MDNNGWILKKMGEWIFLLHNVNDGEKDILNKRFKKDLPELERAYELFDLIGSLRFEDGIRFGYDNRW